MPGCTSISRNSSTSHSLFVRSTMPLRVSELTNSQIAPTVSSENLYKCHIVNEVLIRSTPKVHVVKRRVADNKEVMNGVGLANRSSQLCAVWVKPALEVDRN